MKKQTLSYYLLIPGSLVLLASFLAYWLYDSYQKEQAQLKTEIERTVIDAKRTIQDSLMHDLFNTSLSEYSFKDSFLIDSGFPDIKGTAEIQIISNAGEMDDSHFNSLKKIIKSADSKELKSNISIIMDHGFDSMDLKSPFQTNPDFTKLILNRVTQDIQHSNLPEFSIISADSNASKNNRIEIKVFSSHHSDNYIVSFERTHWYILKKILAQIFFSILLFSITCLAFYFIQQSLQEQKNLLAMKNNFISNMTHELKTPISTIGVAIEAMQDFDVLKEPEKAKEYLAFSKTELGRLSLLVEKVLNMAKFESGNYALKRESVDLAALLLKVLNSMQLQLQKANAKVVKEFKLETPYLINGDPVHLSNVIYNLIDNSIKYSDLPAVIHIQLTETPQEILLLFSDQGIGIPSAFQDRVFDRFFRVPTGNTHNVKGHGLGLNYIAEIIQKHNGNISLKSEEGIGTRFKISLPKHEE